MIIPLALFRNIEAAGAPADTIFLWNCENGGLGSQPTTDDQGLGLTYFTTDAVNFPEQELVADPAFGSFAVQSVGGAAPLSSDTSNIRSTLTIDMDIGGVGVDTCIEGRFEFSGNISSSVGQLLFGVTGSGIGATIQSRRNGSDNQIGIGFQIGSLVETWALNVHLVVGTRYHVVLARFSDIYTLYLDGVSVATYDAATHPSGPDLPSTSYEMFMLSTGENATISDAMRVVRNCAVYYDPFEVPSVAPVAISACPARSIPNLMFNAKDSAGAMVFPYTTDCGEDLALNGGVPQFSAIASKFGSTSLIPLAGDSPPTSGFQSAFLSKYSLNNQSSFCLQGWFYWPTPTALGGFDNFRNIMRAYVAGGFGPKVSSAAHSTGVPAIQFRVEDDITSRTSASLALPAYDQWIHIALAVNNLGIEGYVDGVSVYSDTYPSVLSFNQFGAPEMSAQLLLPNDIDAGTGSQTNVVGYNDGFKYTNGDPVYTANFPVPTSPFVCNP